MHRPVSSNTAFSSCFGFFLVATHKQNEKKGMSLDSVAAVAPAIGQEAAFMLNSSLLVLAAIGSLQLLAIMYGFSVFVYRTWVRKPNNLLALYGKDGWACITGATDGIGKSLAFELAKRGLNIVLISRTQSKLESTREEILAKYPNIKVDVLAVDFSSREIDYAKVKSTLLALPGAGLTVLVNNVGVSYDFPCYFEELPVDRVEDMIRLNIDSTTNMTKLGLDVLKHKPNQQQRRRGAIVNIGSAAGLTSNPLLTQYSAAKAYVQRFSEGLAVEVKNQGIDVQCHVPFFIVSKLSKFRTASAFIPSPDTYAKLVVNAVGMNEIVVNPVPGHAVVGFFVKNVIPNAWRERFTRNHHLSIRTKALKKQAKKE